MKNENPYIISHFQVRWKKYLRWHYWKTNVDPFFSYLNLHHYASVKSEVTF